MLHKFIIDRHKTNGPLVDASLTKQTEKKTKNGSLVS